MLLVNVSLAILCTCETIQSKVIDNSNFRNFLELVPEIRELINDFYSRYLSRPSGNGTIVTNILVVAARNCFQLYNSLFCLSIYLAPVRRFPLVLLVFVINFGFLIVNLLFAAAMPPAWAIYRS